MFNYRPKCNNEKIEFIEQQYFVCSDCDFTYYHNVASAVAAIIVYQEKVLFTTRAQAPGLGFLDLPGGFVDPNESLEQALSREIKEELAVNISDWQYLCSQPNIYLSKNIEYRTLDSIFISQQKDPLDCVLQASEISKVTWLKPEQINFEQIAFPSIKAALQTYLDKANTSKKM